MTGAATGASRSRRGVSTWGGTTHRHARVHLRGVVPSSGSESPLMWPHVARLGGRADTCRARLFARATFAHRDLRNCFEFPPVLFPDCRPGGGFQRGSLGAARSRRAAEGAASKECVRMRRKLELPVVLSARCERRCVVCFNAFVDFAQSVLCSVYLACVSFGK